MNIGFAGTPQFAATILVALLASKHDVALVLTQPGRPSGRGRRIRPGPVETLCRERSLVVHTPSTLNGVESTLEPLDVLVVAAYGLLLPTSVLSAPRLGCMNVHASLLPRWRGASPIEHAILHGDKETGVSIMRITRRLDAGPVFRQAALPLTSESTTSSITEELSQLGGAEIVKVLDDAEIGLLDEPHAQIEDQATYAPRLPNEAAQINWRESASQLERHIRAFHGRRMAFTTLQQATREVRIRVLDAKLVDAVGDPGQILSVGSEPVVGCGTGALALRTVQLNIGNGRVMSGADAVNGFSDVWQVGTRFAISSETEDA